jgi:hypothetical protein
VVHRDQRGRVLAALEGAVKQFRTREELWPLRVPKEPLVLETIVRRILDHDASRFDLASLRSRSLLSLRWHDGSWWELWVLALGSGIKLFCDSSPEESRILASGRRDSEIDTERLFLELLAESAGEVFGIEISGGLPSRVRSSVERPPLVEFFLHLFEVAHMEDFVRTDLSAEARSAKVEGAKSDFREDVEHWLEKVMR